MNYETPLEADGEMVVSERDSTDRRLVYAVGAVLAVLAGLLIYYFLAPSRDDETPIQLPVVSVTVPGTTSIAGTVQASGTIAARRELPVGSVGEGGRVVSVPVDAGEWVKKGQVLAVVDRGVQTQQIAGASAQIDVAKADAQLAQANLDRALKLVAKGFISKADVDRLTATRDAAVARVRVAQAQTAELRARTSRLDIVAPAGGLLLTRNVDPGQVVGAGSGVLFSIARGGELELLARLGEDDLAGIHVGTPADVVPVGTDKHFTGSVWQIAPTIDPDTRQGTARIALSYAEELRPGGFATATIGSGTVIAPMLPESAILSDDKGSFVLVVGKGDKVERRAVTIGEVTDKGIAVTSGLTGRETVVLRAGGFLAPGDQIKPRMVRQQKN